MKIGVILPPGGDRPGGLGIYVEEICSRLIRMHDDCLFLAEDEATVRRWGGLVPVAPTQVGFAARFAGHWLHRRLGRLVSFRNGLARELTKHDIDVLFVPFHDGLRRSPVPQVIVAHDLTFERYPEAYKRAVVWYARRMFRPVLRRAERVIAVSESTRRDLETIWGIEPQRIRVVAEGFDRDLFRRQNQEEIDRVKARYSLDRPYLFYAGTFSRHKNLSIAIEALGRVHSRVPELELVLTGPRGSGHFAELMARVKKLGLTEHVRHLGYIERPDLGPLMSGAAAFVFPSLSEGFGLAVLEALASGAPVIAANRTSLPEVVGDAGLLVDPEDVEAWANAILRTLNKDERSRLQRLGLARAERFNWDSSAQHILEILTEVSRDSSQPAVS